MANFKRNFIGVMNFVKDNTINPKRGVGANTLYTKRKGNSYFLLDMENTWMEDDDASPLWTIHSNESKFDDFSIRNRENLFLSDRKKPNDKFIISQFLTLFFKRQKAIPSKKRNYYYNRIRQLLFVQWNVIKKRLNSKCDNNRQTKTFIRFTYKHKTFYLGFYVGCTRCHNPTAVVKSNFRRECYEHWKQDVIPNIRKQWSPIDHLLKNDGKIKDIISLRQKKKYRKVTRLVDDGNDRNALITASIPIGSDGSKGQPTIKISKHFKCMNIMKKDILFDSTTMEIKLKDKIERSEKYRYREHMIEAEISAIHKHRESVKKGEIPDVDIGTEIDPIEDVGMWRYTYNKKVEEEERRIGAEARARAKEKLAEEKYQKEMKEFQKRHGF